MAGVTGHQNIPEHAVGFIRRELRRVLNELSEARVGVTSLAAGADQLFANTMLELGGRLHVVVPSANYEVSFADAEARAQYEHFLSQAEKIERLPHPAPSEAAYLEAGHRIADLADVLLAIWDGQPARGRGGTADIVEYASSIGKRVVVIWPTGIQRP